MCDDIATLPQLLAEVCGCRTSSMWSETLCARDDTRTLSRSRVALELSMTRVAVSTATLSVCDGTMTACHW